MTCFSAKKSESITTLKLETCRICGHKMSLKLMKEHSSLCHTRSELEQKLMNPNNSISKCCDEIFMEKKKLNLAIAMEQYYSIVKTF